MNLNLLKMEDKAEKKKQREAAPQPYKLKKNDELISRDKRPFVCSKHNLTFHLERDLKRHFSNAHNRKNVRNVFRRHIH